MALESLQSKRVLLFIAVGLVAFVLYLYFYVGTINFIDVVEHANLFYYSSAFGAFIAATLFSALTWKSLLRNLNIKTTIRRTLLLTWAGYFFDATLPEPGWSGDLSKAYLLSKKSGQDMGRIVASVVSQKIIGMVVTVVGLALGLGLLATEYTLPALVLVFLGGVLFVTVAALVVVYYVSRRPKVTQKMLNWLIRLISFILRSHWDAVAFRNSAESSLRMFHEGIESLSSDKKALIRPVLLYTVSIVFDVSLVFFVFAALGSVVPVDTILIVYALTGTIQSIGMSFVGFTEIIMSTSYTVLGIQPALSFSVTLLTRVVTLWFKLVVAYFAFQWASLGILLGKKKKDAVPAGSEGDLPSVPVYRLEKHFNADASTLLWEYTCLQRLC